MKSLWHPFLAVLLAVLAQGAAALDLQALWDFSQPQLSEQRFVAAMAGATADERLILQTQIARSHGLRRDFVRARAILAELQAQLAGASPEAQTRYQLELGRTFASGAHTEPPPSADDLQAARRCYLRAHELARAARLDDLAIDALHMMVFVDTEPEQQLAWNRRALALMVGSDQPAARRWEGSLRHNLAYALQLQGEHEAALQEFRLSRAAYERAGRSRNVAIADWMIARTLRQLGRLNEALSLQQQLERTADAAGRPDRYVYEELELLHRALGDEAQASRYGDKARAAR